MVEKLVFNLSNFIEQEFPFPVELIDYINNEADAEIKQMLDRSCKYFYKEAPYLIVDSLEFEIDMYDRYRIENETYDGCMDFIDDDELEIFLETIRNIWVTKKMNISFEHDLAAAFYDRIRLCDASEVSISHSIWPFSELQMLTKSGKVENLNLLYAKFCYQDHSLVPLEDILAMVPNARIIRVYPCHITGETITKLLSIPWKNKITEFSLTGVDGPFCADLFFEFVKSYVDPEASIDVDFKDEDDTFKQLYNQRVLESDEKMPMFEIYAPPADIKMSLEDEPKKITFNDDDAERQYTAFPYPHMCYIRENADAETWKKLERTCKYYYPKNAYFMVDDFEVASDGKITLMVDEKELVFENYEEVKRVGKPLWITDSIDIFSGSAFDHTYSNLIHATLITITQLDCPKNLLISLTKYGLVKEWYSLYCRIKCDNERSISLKELLIHLPNADNIVADVCGINYQNAIESASLPQQNKVKILELRFIEEPIHAHQLYDVLTKILALKADVELGFKELNNEMDVPQFQIELKAKLDTWKPQIERPTVRFRF